MVARACFAYPPETRDACFRRLRPCNYHAACHYLLENRWTHGKIQARFVFLSAGWFVVSMNFELKSLLKPVELA